MLSVKLQVFWIKHLAILLGIHWREPNYNKNNSFVINKATQLLTDKVARNFRDFTKLQDNCVNVFTEGGGAALPLKEKPFTLRSVIYFVIKSKLYVLLDKIWPRS